MEPIPHVVPALINFGSGIHWIIILFVALLLFGRRLPEIMRGMGGSIRAFKKGIDEGAAPLDAPNTTSGEKQTQATPDLQRQK